jgi:hypothetical protein
VPLVLEYCCAICFTHTDVLLQCYRVRATQLVLHAQHMLLARTWCSLISLIMLVTVLCVHVVEQDENNFGADALQKLLFEMCFMQVRTYTDNIPNITL